MRQFDFHLQYIWRIIYLSKKFNDDFVIYLGSKLLHCNIAHEIDETYIDKVVTHKRGHVIVVFQMLTLPFHEDLLLFVDFELPCHKLLNCSSLSISFNPCVD